MLCVFLHFLYICSFSNQRNVDMQKTSKLLFIFVAYILCGCNQFKSYAHFTDGTKCLEKRDYHQARFHFEKACEFDSSSSENHNNLACVHIQLGEYNNAWLQSRQAVLLDPGHDAAVTTFNNLLTQLLISNCIGRDSTIEEVKTALGEPDMISEKTCSIFQYGLLLLLFENGKLVEKSMMFGVKNAWSIPQFEPI